MKAICVQFYQNLENAQIHCFNDNLLTLQKVIKLLSLKFNKRGL